MRNTKMLAGVLVVVSALKGIYTCFLELEEDNLVRVIVFTLILLLGAWIMKTSWRKVYKLLIAISALQIIALKTENVDYVFGLGISIVQYFKVISFQPDQLVLSSSYANLSLAHNSEASLIGINVAALLFLTALIIMRKKQKSYP